LTENLVNIVKLHHTDDVEVRRTLCKVAAWKNDSKLGVVDPSSVKRRARQFEAASSVFDYPAKIVLSVMHNP